MLKYLDKSYTTYGISQYKRMQVDECIQEKDIAANQISSLFSQNIEEEKYSNNNSTSGYIYDGYSSKWEIIIYSCLLYTSPSPRDQRGSRMPSSA